MRIKGETHEELMGVLKALKESLKNEKRIPQALDLSINYDGKIKSPYILPSAIAICTNAGVCITYHYAERVPAKEGVNLYEVLRALDFLGINKDRFAVLHQKEFVRELYDLLPLRRELGFRTLINVVEKLLNPFGAKSLITSLFHKPYFEKLDALCRELGFNRYLLIKGMEGGIEPLTDRPTLYKLKGESVSEAQARRLGLKTPKKLVSHDPFGDSLRINRDILEGRATEEFVGWALYSSAFLLLASGTVENLEEGVRVAERSYEALLKGLESYGLTN
jgi:anthranilate phosphoribosyltransferase